MGRRTTSALAAALVLTLTACGGSPPGVRGSITDTQAPVKADCGSADGTLQVALTSASGQIIARDSAPFQWSGGACRLPFSFSNVPQLATYGIRVMGLGGGIVWLTPAQASQTVSLRIGPGFTLSRAR